MEKTITIKWIRSAIGRTHDQRETLRGLGFKRLHQTLTLPNRPEIRGMINSIIHLLEVNPSIPRLEGQGLLKVDPEGHFHTAPSRKRPGAAKRVKES